MDTTGAACHAALLDDWAAEVLGLDTVEALTVNVADADQGRYAREPDEHGLVPNADALVVLGLERAHDLDDLPARDLLHKLARRVDVWRVLSYRRKGDEPTASDAPTPGIKYVSLVTRAEGLTHEQFVRHWTERHTPLALEHHVGMSGYTQRVVRRAYTPGGRTIDGIAELTFPTRAALDERFYDSDAGKRVIGDDVTRFIQRVPGSPTLMTERVLR
jgi:uncharacterized protein (TIGR02118 family)